MSSCKTRDEYLYVARLERTMEYDVRGADALTGLDRTLEVTADSEKEAVAIANTRGVFPYHVSPVYEPPPVPVCPGEPPSVTDPPRVPQLAVPIGSVIAIVILILAVYGLSTSSSSTDTSSPSPEYDSYSLPDSPLLPERRVGVTREDVRRTLREMESNVPKTLQEMEDSLPDTMADLEREMMRDAHKYGLSPSEVRAQLREIQSGTRDQIRGMEDDVKREIRNMEDDVLRELQRLEGQ